MAIVVGMLGTLAYAFIRDQLAMHHAETPLIVDVKTTTAEKEELCGPNTRDGRPTPISMLYSDDKQRWIESSAQTFSQLCPNIQVKLHAMDDVSSADAILDGREHPTIWAPADDLVVDYLDARWAKERPNDAQTYLLNQRTPVAASPLVVLIWRDRMQVAKRILNSRPITYGPWVTGVCAQVPIDAKLDGVVLSDMVPGTWIDWYNPIMPPPEAARPNKAAKKPPEPKLEDLEIQDPRSVYRAPFPTLEKIRSWGQVKMVHPSPTRSAVGLEAVYMMAYDYVLPFNQHSAEKHKFYSYVISEPSLAGQVVPLDIQKEDFARALQEKRDKLLLWLRRCEAGLDPTPTSPRLLTDSFFHVGSTRYDAVITYEHLVFSILKQVDEYGGAITSMEVYYPTPTLMNQHPVVTRRTADLSPEEKRAADKWVAYLRSESAQKAAVDLGLRPVNPKVSIREYDSEDNPFLKYRRYGIDFVSPIVEPPRLDKAAVADLVRIWQDATGRN
jgi:Bacterial extracellular solute-binding protein